jgi:hypothetical protein
MPNHPPRLDRWPEPRPPLFPQPAGPAGTAALIRGPLGPGLPRERAWLLHASAEVAASHAGAFELSCSAARVRRDGEVCLRLTIRTAAKDGSEIGRFHWHALWSDHAAIRALGAIDRQPWWRVMVRDPDDGLNVVELANTLRLAVLVRSVLHGVDHER